MSGGFRDRLGFCCIADGAGVELFAVLLAGRLFGHCAVVVGVRIGFRDRLGFCRIADGAGVELFAVLLARCLFGHCAVVKGMSGGFRDRLGFCRIADGASIKLFAVLLARCLLGHLAAVVGMCVGFRQRDGKAIGAVGRGLPDIYRAALCLAGCGFFNGIGVVVRAQLRQRYRRLGAALRASAGQRSDGGNGRRGCYGVGIGMLASRRLELPCGLDGLHAVGTVA